MQPMIFLQNGESGFIKRVKGASDTKRFLAGLGFVEDAKVSVISRMNGSLIVNIKDSRVAINEDMAKKIMIQMQG